MYVVLIVYNIRSLSSIGPRQIEGQVVRFDRSNIIFLVFIYYKIFAFKNKKIS